MEPDSNDPDLIAYNAAVAEYNAEREKVRAARRSQEIAEAKMWSLAGVMIEKGYRITLPL